MHPTSYCEFRSTWLVALAVLALGAASAHASNDEVHLVKGGVQSGAIVDDSNEGIKLRVGGSGGGGASVTVETKDIKQVVWDIQNSEWTQGMRDMQVGDNASAATAFQSIANDPESLQSFRPQAKPYLFYLVGDCLYKAGKHQDAVDAFEKYMADFPNSRYIGLAVGSLVDSAIQAKKLEKVPPLLEKLRALGGENKIRALIFAAEVDLNQTPKNLQGAESKFNEAANGSADPETRALARLGQATVAMEKKDLAKAKQMAEQALSSSATPAVAGTAHLIIGKAYMEEAAGLKGDASKEKLLDAVLSFLRVHVLYGKDKRTEPEALYRAGECFLTLSKLKDRGLDRMRAQTMFGLVVSNYRTNRWAALAQESQSKIK